MIFFNATAHRLKFDKLPEIIFAQSARSVQIDEQRFFALRVSRFQTKGDLYPVFRVKFAKKMSKCEKPAQLIDA